MMPPCSGAGVSVAPVKVLENQSADRRNQAIALPAIEEQVHWDVHDVFGQILAAGVCGRKCVREAMVMGWHNIPRPLQKEAFSVEARAHSVAPAFLAQCQWYNVPCRSATAHDL